MPRYMMAEKPDPPTDPPTGGDAGPLLCHEIDEAATAALDPEMGYAATICGHQSGATPLDEPPEGADMCPDC